MFWSEDGERLSFTNSSLSLKKRIIFRMSYPRPNNLFKPNSSGGAKKSA